MRAFGSVSVWYGMCAMRCLGVSGGGWLEAVFAAVFVPGRSGVLHGGAPDFFYAYLFELQAWVGLIFDLKYSNLPIMLASSAFHI